MGAVMKNSGWKELKRFTSANGRRKVVILESRDSYFKYEALRWQKYYEPSDHDDNGPIEDGLWIEEYISGLFASAEDAELDARNSVVWFSTN